MWSESRTASKTATVSLFGKAYEVEAALAGAKVELVFDPFDLGEIGVRYQGRETGRAVPQVIRRHVHPEARAETLPDPRARTGIDYLSVVEARFAAQTRRSIAYGALDEEADGAGEGETS